MDLLSPASRFPRSSLQAPRITAHPLSVRKKLPCSGTSLLHCRRSCRRLRVGHWFGEKTVGGRSGAPETPSPAGIHPKESPWWRQQSSVRPHKPWNWLRGRNWVSDSSGPSSSKLVPLPVTAGGICHPRRESPAPAPRGSGQSHHRTPSVLAKLLWWRIGCVICQHVVSLLAGVFLTLLLSRWIVSSLSDTSAAFEGRFSWALPRCSSMKLWQAGTKLVAQRHYLGGSDRCICFHLASEWGTGDLCRPFDMQRSR